MLNNLAIFVQMGLEVVTVLTELRKAILHMQGFKSPTSPQGRVNLPYAVRVSFPNAVFPISAVHEFMTGSAETVSASVAFIAHLAGDIITDAGVCAHIGSMNLYPPCLPFFKIPPEKMLFVRVRKNQILDALEETLKCDRISSVIADVPHLSFKQSRRLQLAVERSGCTAFIIRPHIKHEINACVTRWRIQPAHSVHPNQIPGIGFPAWKVTLDKVRNGKPGSWLLYADGGKLKEYNKEATAQELIRKIV